MNNLKKKSDIQKRQIACLARFFVGPQLPSVGIPLPSVAPFIGDNKPFIGAGSPRGFTLIELVVTLAVASVLLVVAVPNIRTFVQNSRARTQINDLVTDLTYARSQAVKRGLSVGLCPSNDGATCLAQTSWQGGYLTFIDANLDGVLDTGDTVVRYRRALSGGDLLGLAVFPSGTTPTILIFTGTSQPPTNLPLGSSEFRFSLSDPSRPSCSARVISVDSVGEVSTHQGIVSSCP